MNTYLEILRLINEYRTGKTFVPIAEIKLRTETIFNASGTIDVVTDILIDRVSILSMAARLDLNVVLSNTAPETDSVLSAYHQCLIRLYRAILQDGFYKIHQDFNIRAKL